MDTMVVAVPTIMAIIAGHADAPQHTPLPPIFKSELLCWPSHRNFGAIPSVPPVSTPGGQGECELSLHDSFAKGRFSIRGAQ
jgi:hypothetical protein